MRALLFLIIGAIAFAIGESLQCYNCAESSLGNLPGLNQCKPPYSSHDNNEKCYVRNSYCLKGTATVDGETFVMRQCQPAVAVPDIIDDLKLPEPSKDPVEMTLYGIKFKVHVCATDLCNAASLPSVTTSFAILLLTTVLLM